MGEVGEDSESEQSEPNISVLIREKLELQKKLAEFTASKVEVSPQKLQKPTLESCDFDEVVFEQRYDEWQEQEHQQKQSRSQQEKEWEDQKARYRKSKEIVSSKASDYDISEDLVKADFSIEQQTILVRALDLPAQMVYAIGKNARLRERLAKIKDPITFTKEVTKLELMATKKISPHKPPPEQRVQGGTGGKISRKDASLERLRAEAERTGDMTDLLKYKRNLRKA